MIKEERRKASRRKKKAIIAAILLLLIGIAALVVVKVFVVTEVIVSGNQLYDDKKIQETVLNDDKSGNTLWVYFKYRFQETPKLPFIDTLEVGMEIPHTITIEVYEKGMIGYIYYAEIDQNIFFDKDGFVVEISKTKIDGIPQILGLNCTNTNVEEQLDLDNDKALGILLGVSQTLKKYNVVPDSIHFASGNKLELTYNKVTVNLGNTDHLTEKIKRLEQILPEISKSSGTLHLEDWSEENTDIIFKKSN